MSRICWPPDRTEPCPYAPAMALLLLGPGVFQVMGQTPAQVPSLDTRPAFMQIVTNHVVRTNLVVVTNVVITTNLSFSTNLFNAQGILLQPVPPAPGLIPIPATPATSAPTPAKPDATLVKARQLQGLRELLAQALTDSSNRLVSAGSFTTNLEHQISIPQGLTSFDRRKSQSLIIAMNQTAEKAAPGTWALLSRLASGFLHDDPPTLIKGSPDAATRALLSSQKAAIETQLLALVQQGGAETKLRETYSSVMLKGGGLLGAVLGSGPAIDIEAHVAHGILQAFANQLSARESVIRKDPAARKTAALQEAFKQ